MKRSARAKARALALQEKAAYPRGLNGVDDSRGWIPMGRWGQDDPSWFQRDIQVHHGAVLANWAVFSCITLISSDIGKVGLRLVEQVGGIWRESENSAAFSPVLRKPNTFQTRQQFIEAWLVSKLTRGNAYVLKTRDLRGVVTNMHVLDPQRVRPLVAPDGAVFYELCDDNLADVKEQVAVPASEIIHDRFNCLFHPLVGLSPIFASGLAAMQGLHIQTNSAKFFRNMSQPGGVLTAPTKISDEAAKRIKTYWESEFSGERAGRVAVLGDGLSYAPMAVNPVDAEMTAQLKMSAEMVCSTFHVPAFKIGAGTIPAGQKVEDLNQIYYSDCLQALMEAIEACLDDGLGLVDTGRDLGTEFDLDGLLKMDSATMAATTKMLIDGSIMSPNEGRLKHNLPPVPGGDAPLSQQQNFSLEALSKRDATADPFGKTAPAAPTPPEALPAKEMVDLTAKVTRQEEMLGRVLEAIDGLKQQPPEPEDDVEMTVAKQLAERVIAKFAEASRAA